MRWDPPGRGVRWVPSANRDGSFYPAHHITMGEGGAVLTDKPDPAGSH